MYRIEYQPRLIEEAVLRAITGHTGERRFRKERDRVYVLADADAREETFQALHQQWYEHLRLAAPLEAALACWPILKTETHKCVLTRAQSPKEIGADLFVAPTPSEITPRERRALVIRLTAELLTQPHNLLRFLRHEFLHIVDMLDPNFGYEPELPKSAIGPTYDRLLRDRYRILWDITIDGRLVQKGWLEPEIKNNHWLSFKGAFCGPKTDIENIFSFFFSNQRPVHGDLVAFARSPEGWFVNLSEARPSKGLCSICNFPTFDFVNTATALSSLTLERIREDVPAWQPDQPICRQCADLYESRVSALNSTP
ncbi:MAG TPA: hypothetical protein VGA99_08315 [bacterium]